jgi:hypothetical protein
MRLNTELRGLMTDGGLTDSELNTVSGGAVPCRCVKPGAPWDASPQNVLRPTGGMKTSPEMIS